MEKKENNRLLIYLGVLIAGGLWGFSFLATSLLMENGIDPIQIQAWRWTLASACFLVFVLFGKLRIDLHKKSAKYLILPGIFEPCMYMIFENYGIKYTSASIGSIFVAVIPCVVLIIGAIFLKRKTSIRGKISIFLAVFGVILATVLSPDFSIEGSGIGYLLLIGAVIAGGLYNIFIAVVSGDYEPMEITAVMAFVGMIFFNVLNFAMGYGFDTYITVIADRSLLIGVVYLGVCCSAITFLVLNKVLSVMNPAVGNNLVSGTVTICGVFAGVVFGGDPCGWYTILGLAFTVIGVWLASREV